MTKTCTKCGVEKALSEFHKDKSKKDGLRSSCKSCKSLQNSQYRENNKEKELERDHQYRKNLPAGIYKITNKQTGFIYIGCSTQLKRRFRVHKNYLKKNKHENKLLQEAYNQYGLDAFEFEVIKEYPADTPFEVLEKEETRLILENHTKGIPMYNLSIKINSIDENLLTK